jgi:hypothetical protein
MIKAAPFSARCGKGGEDMPEDSRYEISVDGIVRTHRHSLEIATEAANVLKACKPYSNVVVRDLLTGKVIESAASSPLASRARH